MGSGFSNEQEKTRAKAKIKAVAKLNKHTAEETYHSAKKSELQEMIWQSKMCKDNVATNDDQNSDNHKRIRQPSLQGPELHRIDSELRIMTHHDDKCFLCDEYIQNAHLGYPCRVCTRIFHKECLEKSGQLTSGDLRLLTLAHTNNGWSCYDCSNMCTLLLPEEVRIMDIQFKKYDINKDCNINMEEFVNFKKRRYRDEEDEEMTEDDVKRQEIEFKLMDVDGSGELNWWEFMNHEASRCIAKRKPEDLVKLLTTKEISEIQSLFRKFDVNNDNVIHEFEAKKVFRQWYSHFDSAQTRSRSISLSGGIQRETTSLGLHVDQQTSILMGGDRDNDGVVTYDEFLLDQALYKICNRVNRGNMSFLKK
ncbi:unnamed protein product [Owenia fusiformis]|uniref:EF-hand domain-containing protein n=1 Tax=Owenia fusiformis TaxID=6347 RepID=A0A8S4N2D1_OWEFU|nr:unnamed protein product [Owenia fusiformis]